MNPTVVVRQEVDAAGKTIGRGLWIWCPGCDKAHRVSVVAETGERPSICWDWNDATDSTFTISPSLLVWTGDQHKPQPGDRRCHSYVKEGQWQFLNDCTHSLAGKTVPMVPVPDWLARE